MSPKNNRGHVKPFRVGKNGSMLFMVPITLIPGRDDDLIVQIRDTRVGELAAKVREMMRNGISSGRFLSGSEDEAITFNVDSLGVEL